MRIPPSKCVCAHVHNPDALRGNSGQEKTSSNDSVPNSWSDFKTDGHDATGIAFAHSQQPGKFGFEIDEVEIK